MTEQKFLRIEQLSLETGLTKRTIRYYEEIGLLPPATRSGGNYRLFPPETVRRLRMICRFRSTLGLSLAQTRAIVEAEEEIEMLRSTWSDQADSHRQEAKIGRAITLIGQQVALIDEKVDALRELRAGLEARREALRKKQKARAQQGGAPR
jgi:DNA-binding transcriptional MerR regulator